MSQEDETPIVIYENANHTVEVRLDTGRDTVWLTQRQMAELFDTSTDNVGLHLKNIYKDDELDEPSTTEDSSVLRQEGARQVSRRIKLYFVIKNHPFSDGNKRSAAYLFVDFLHRNHRLISPAGEPVINDVGLAALTLLVAESDPDNKETMIRLIMNMLAHETETA
ncbi:MULTISPECIES: Fic family protein [unclassified Thioalkalivibrio]|uniref:Fic family protein n=1 Tax=unclassified Thioalkalivibrio TaxID=2621013 RepID=UPI000363EE58|nr:MULTISPECIES: Fic family protein [unclassified Thioalkalivibrio]